MAGQGHRWARCVWGGIPVPREASERRLATQAVASAWWMVPPVGKLQGEEERFLTPAQRQAGCLLKNTTALPYCIFLSVVSDTYAQSVVIQKY